MVQSYSISILDEIQTISGVIALPFGEFTVKFTRLLEFTENTEFS